MEIDVFSFVRLQRDRRSLFRQAFTVERLHLLNVGQGLTAVGPVVGDAQGGTSATTRPVVSSRGSFTR